MNTISRTLTGVASIILGIILTIMGIFTILTLIYGIPLIIIGIFILLNKKEDDIEQIKGGKKK